MKKKPGLTAWLFLFPDGDERMENHLQYYLSIDKKAR